MYVDALNSLANPSTCPFVSDALKHPTTDEGVRLTHHKSDKCKIGSMAKVSSFVSHALEKLEVASKLKDLVGKKRWRNVRYSNYVCRRVKPLKLANKLILLVGTEQIVFIKTLLRRGFSICFWPYSNVGKFDLKLRSVRNIFLEFVKNAAFMICCVAAPSFIKKVGSHCRKFPPVGMNAPHLRKLIQLDNRYAYLLLLAIQDRAHAGQRTLLECESDSPLLKLKHTTALSQKGQETAMHEACKQ